MRNTMPETITITHPKNLAAARANNPDAPIIVAMPGRCRMLHEPGRQPRNIGFAVVHRYVRR